MTATSKPSTNRVLTTPEILEMILLRTDMPTLLTSAQRVCRDWFDLITNSPPIQKALFFTPIKDFEWGAERKIPNPVLAEKFPSIFPANDRSNRRQFSFSDLEMTVKDPLAMALFVRANASWRRMLVQQPPIAELGLFIFRTGIGGALAATASFPANTKDQNAGYDGLRMERLFEMLLLYDNVRFSMITQIYWVIEKPIHYAESYPKINKEFDRVLGTFGLVLCTWNEVNCVMGRYPNTAEDLIRREIVKAYRENGLDVDAKEKLIKDSICSWSSTYCGRMD